MNSGKSIQTTISYAVFILSGFLIFSPLHKSSNLPLSLICSVTTSAGMTLLTARIFSSERGTSGNHGISKTILSISASILSLFNVLILLTEVIKDVAYIANRGVSIFYYTAIALSLLFVSFWLCTSSSKGIYRFCLLSIIPFIILFTTMFFALSTTKSVVFDFSQTDKSFTEPILTGIKSGLFFTADSVVFCAGFKDNIKTDSGTFPKKQFFTGFLVAYTYIIIYNIFTALIFGRLTCEISDPDYALIKLIQGIDLTEIISAIRIVSFLIKSALYIYLSSANLKKCNAFGRFKEISITAFLYLLLPATFLFLAFFDKSLKYGAFQHMIYSITFLMSFCFFLFAALFQKK